MFAETEPGTWVTMKKIVWSEDYKISSFLVNLRGRAGLYAVLNLIQDVGWLHAFHWQVKLGPHQGWVFTRQKLMMQEWPKWNETVTVKTWLRPPQDLFLLRDYEIFVQDRKIGECTSTFTVMDMKTRKLSKVDWSGFQEVWRQDHQLTNTPEKIQVSMDAKELAQFEVRNSDIDMNQHVNNTKYAQWILDALPLEILKEGVELHDYEVNFLAETKSGDVVSVQKFPTELKKGETQFTHFQGIRISDSKPVFTARFRSTATDT